MNETQEAKVTAAVWEGNKGWISAFNRGDGKGCAAYYEADAVMHARPFGTFTAMAEITAFWEKLITDGFGEVEYLNPLVEVIDETSAILRSGWKMNKGGGVIHKEVWVLQSDGRALIREDDFEKLY